MTNNYLITKYKSEINNQLLQVYNNGPNSLVEPINYVLSGRGKRLRPILTLFTSESLGGSISNSISAALAIEILHNFTLVHDDIMDEDSLRHGKPTVHKKWAIGTAILSGDAMLSIALRMIQKSPKYKNKLMQSFINGLQAVCEGQALDKEFELEDKVSQADYIKMIDLKTGFLIGLSAELGAISAGATKDQIKCVRDYGRLIGRAFQIQDDLLEIFSDSNNMGKSLESDLILGKKTYLMIQAKQTNPTEIAKALDLSKDNYSLGLKKIRNIMTDLGIRQKAEQEIKFIIDEANTLITKYNICVDKFSFFSNLINNRGN